jgi:hypothetical protein
VSGRTLIACEFSGVVRDAFRARGVDAVSCDLLPTERPGPHIQGDVLAELGRGEWDTVIAFPPCTYLSRAGQHLWPGRQAEQMHALLFVLGIWSCGAPRVAIENPRGALSFLFRPPDQVVDPSDFGAHYRKATCLWLRGLPPLLSTYRVASPTPFVAAFPHSGAGHARQGAAWRRRVRFPAGIAEAMADQWSAVVVP